MNRVDFADIGRYLDTPDQLLPEPWTELGRYAAWVFQLHDSGAKAFDVEQSAQIRQYLKLAFLEGKQTLAEIVGGGDERLLAAFVINCIEATCGEDADELVNDGSGYVHLVGLMASVVCYAAMREPNIQAYYEETMLSVLMSNIFSAAAEMTGEKILGPLDFAMEVGRKYIKSIMSAEVASIIAGTIVYILLATYKDGELSNKRVASDDIGRLIPYVFFSVIGLSLIELLGRSMQNGS